MAEKDAAYWASPADQSPQREQEPSSAGGAVGSFLRSMGRETTAGLTDYPAAALMAGVRRLQGLPFDYREALRDVRGQTAQAQQEYPVASTTGKLTGAVLGSLGGPKNLAFQVGRQAVTGGVSGFTGNEGFENVGRDVGTGAAIGGGLGLLGGAVGQAARPLTNLVRNQYAARQGEVFIDYANKMRESAQKLEPTLNRVVNALPPAKTTKAADYFQRIKNTNPEAVIDDIAKFGDKTRANAARDAGFTFTPKEIADAKAFTRARGVLESTTNKLETAQGLSGPELFDYARGGLGFGALRTGQAYLRSAKEMLPGIALGGAGGATLGAVTSVGPVAGAAMGAGLAGLNELRTMAIPVAARAAAAGAAQLPGAGRVGAGVATRYGAEPIEPEIDYSVPADQYVPQQTQPRLLRLAEEFRARMGGAE